MHCLPMGPVVSIYLFFHACCLGGSQRQHGLTSVCMYQISRYFIQSGSSQPDLDLIIVSKKTPKKMKHEESAWRNPQLIVAGRG
ncbi:uncharacterized protein BDW43DRAFT_291166 [Aspergillus alliaceus]|uniref:uncharacterized protein n=1 Tax=Petromyces alliaceus TaxID=209559 RepID=UPI0012A50589|nr:uncharacterized protein BDW43DRAFT_291166 [Aspergillus alliaceus]KAB8228496.1 hypothetical protein BDW43DRAFT_291166 [Aspergillus alliaceus]